MTPSQMVWFRFYPDSVTPIPLVSIIRKQDRYYFNFTSFTAYPLPSWFCQCPQFHASWRRLGTFRKTCQSALEWYCGPEMRFGEPFFRTGDLCYLSTLAGGTIQVSKSSPSSYGLFGCDRHWCAVTPELRDTGILADSGQHRHLVEHHHGRCCNDIYSFNLRWSELLTHRCVLYDDHSELKVWWVS